MSDAAGPSPDSAGLVSDHERSVDEDRRRRHGVHYTPREVADGVLDLALDRLGRVPSSVCDPSCGAGAFLLAAADRLVALGVPAAEVAGERLVGVELDPGAVGVARRALSTWASQHGADVAPERVRVHCGDGLALGASVWPDRPAAGFDLVVGNPPFLSQLDRRTARDAERRQQLAGRFGALGAYTDDAGLFLLSSMELVAEAGVVALLQPWSVLSVRDAGPVRDRLLSVAELVGLWAHRGTPFPDAEVHVCAPVLRRRSGPATPGAAAAAGRVEVRVDAPPHRSEQPSPTTGRWGALLAPALGVPTCELPVGTSVRTVSEVAAATAGFRDEFYALCESLRAEDGPSGAELSDAFDAPRLVSVGMIDPFQLRWGIGTHRMAGTRRREPRVDPAQLRVRNPRVARWAADRLVPKVLVATQTRVVEAVADPEGATVPLTPVISVEPVGARIDVWHLAAALAAPPVAATVLREHLGAGRSAGVLRWSAAGVSDTPLPIDAGEWARGAMLARRLQTEVMDAAARERCFDEFAVAMSLAYGLGPDDPVIAWWSQRRPRR